MVVIHYHQQELEMKITFLKKNQTNNKYQWLIYLEQQLVNSEEYDSDFDDSSHEDDERIKLKVLQ